MVESLGRRGSGEEVEAIKIIGTDQMNCKCYNKTSWLYTALRVLLRHLDSFKVFQRGKKNSPLPNMGFEYTA